MAQVPPAGPVRRRYCSEARLPGCSPRLRPSPRSPPRRRTAAPQSRRRRRTPPGALGNRQPAAAPVSPSTRTGWLKDTETSTFSPGPVNRSVGRRRKRCALPPPSAVRCRAPDGLPGPGAPDGAGPPAGPARRRYRSEARLPDAHPVFVPVLDHHLVGEPQHRSPGAAGVRRPALSGTDNQRQRRAPPPPASGG